MKTTEEILNEVIRENPNEPNHYTLNEIYEAMERYADQFKTKEVLSTDYDYILKILKTIDPDHDRRGDTVRLYAKLHCLDIISAINKIGFIPPFK